MNTPAPNPIRLLVVDDHEVVRMGLRTLLSQTPGLAVIGEASTVPEAVEAATRLAPDVVLLDVRLGKESGFDACRRIQALPGDIRVLILTSYADDSIVLEAIQAGADGYLLKEIGAEALLNAIRQVAAGQSILDPSVTKWVLGRIKTDAEPGQGQPRRIDTLSGQERRVLALVAEGRTNKEIARELGLSDKTVKNYFSNILDKLQLTRRSQAAAFYVQETR
jgi:DNA-binding NarL/FixJ family response regulator